MPHAAPRSTARSGPRARPARAASRAPCARSGACRCPRWPGSPGVGKATLSGLENGTRNPTLETLYAVTAQLGVPLTAVAPGSRPSTPTYAAPRSAPPCWRSSPTPTRRTSCTGCGSARTGQLSPAHQPGVTEHVTVFAGVLRAGPVDAPLTAAAGGHLRWTSDVPHSYAAVGDERGTPRACCCAIRAADRPPPTGGGQPGRARPDGRQSGSAGGGDAVRPVQWGGDRQPVPTAQSAASVRDAEPVLRSRLDTCTVTVRTEMPSARATCLLDIPATRQSSTSLSRAVSSGLTPSAAPPARPGVRWA